MPENTSTLEHADAALHPLLAPLERSLYSQRLVVVHQLWHRCWDWALLPFHLHLRWPGTLDTLPLSATFALVPLRHVDARLLTIPMYDPANAKQARLQARAYRNELRSDLK